MIWKFIPSILFAIVALAFAIASKPAPGGTDANVILILPAGVMGVLAIISALMAWIL